MRLVDAQTLASDHGLVLTEQRGMVRHFAHLRRGWHLSLGFFDIDETGQIDGAGFRALLDLHLKVFEGDPVGIEQPNHLNSVEWRIQYWKRVAKHDIDGPLSKNLLRSFSRKTEMLLLDEIQISRANCPPAPRKRFFGHSSLSDDGW